jgi:hypothetical protein
MIEAGDFRVGKVHADLEKLRQLNPRGTNWFLAFFRTAPEAGDPSGELKKSFKRKNGLKKGKVHMTTSLVRSFDVYRPNANPDKFGVALLKG